MDAIVNATAEKTSDLPNVSITWERTIESQRTYNNGNSCRLSEKENTPMDKWHPERADQNRLTSPLRDMIALFADSELQNSSTYQNQCFRQRVASWHSDS